MSYVNVFGGSPVQPAEVAYAAYDLSANLTLVWPFSLYDTGDVAARIMDITQTGSGFTLQLPDATQTSVGQDMLIRNLGSNNFTLINQSGGTLLVITPGQSIYLYLQNNTTVGGVWGLFVFGTGTSSADANTLVGLGLNTLGGVLNQARTTSVITSNYTVQLTDRASLIVWESGVGTVTLPVASTTNSDFEVSLRNQGTGLLTVVTTDGTLIDGLPTLVLETEDSCDLICNGAAWFSVGLGGTVTEEVQVLNLNVSGSSDITLTPDQASRLIQQYSGVLSGDINVICPNIVATYYIANNTTGSFTLTFKPTTGSGVLVPQGNKIIVYCDGNNVYSLPDFLSISDLQLGLGSVSAPSLSFAGNSSTGLYMFAPNNLAVTANGVPVVNINQFGLAVSGSIAQDNLTLIGFVETLS